MAFLPTTVKEARQRGWDSVDVVLFTGDAYIDHLIVAENAERLKESEL